MVINKLIHCIFMMVAMLCACTEAPTITKSSSEDEVLTDASMEEGDFLAPPEYQGCLTDFQCLGENGSIYGGVCMNGLCVQVAESSMSGGDNCLAVKSGCQIYAALGDDSVATAGWYIYRNQFCWNDSATVMLNVMTPKVTKENAPLWALRAEERNVRGNWCTDDVRNQLIDTSCFLNETPEDFGFEVHCTREEYGYPRTLLWLKVPPP